MAPARIQSAWGAAGHLWHKQGIPHYNQKILFKK